MKIAILHHSQTDPDIPKYLLYYCCNNWIESGHSVVHIKGTDSPLPTADLLIVHVNLSVVPDAYIEVAQNYPVVLNKQVTDITRPVFSKNILEKDTNHDGPVIVKTGNNYGGIPERDLATGEDMNPLTTIKNIFEEKFPWLRSWHNLEWLTDYPVYPSVKKVPSDVWRNKNLVVENFLPERRKDGEYLVREWLFFGDCELHYMNISHDPVVRAYNSHTREYMSLDDVPDELRALRARLGFDYGKFDYVIYNGEPLLYDINKTIGASSNLKDRPGAFEYIRAFSQGINYYST